MLAEQGVIINMRQDENATNFVERIWAEQNLEQEINRQITASRGAQASITMTSDPIDKLCGKSKKAASKARNYLVQGLIQGQSVQRIIVEKEKDFMKQALITVANDFGCFIHFGKLNLSTFRLLEGDPYPLWAGIVMFARKYSQPRSNYTPVLTKMLGLARGEKLRLQDTKAILYSGYYLGDTFKNGVAKILMSQCEAADNAIINASIGVDQLTSGLRQLTSATIRIKNMVMVDKTYPKEITDIADRAERLEAKHNYVNTNWEQLCKEWAYNPQARTAIIGFHDLITEFNKKARNLFAQAFGINFDDQTKKENKLESEAAAMEAADADQQLDENADQQGTESGSE